MGEGGERWKYVKSVTVCKEGGITTLILGVINTHQPPRVIHYPR